MSSIQQPAAWPEGVIARYLTVGGATVDLVDNRGSDRISATCMGTLCGWKKDTFLEGMTDDTPEEKQYRFERRLPWAQCDAQAHAERCRAMPKPEARNQ